jgi:hypothetical protein
MAKKHRLSKPKDQRQPRFTWRPVVRPIRWAVIRLNEDGSESHYSYEETEEAVKKMAATMDKAAHEGRE